MWILNSTQFCPPPHLYPYRLLLPQTQSQTRNLVAPPWLAPFQLLQSQAMTPLHPRDHSTTLLLLYPSPCSKLILDALAYSSLRLRLPRFQQLRTPHFRSSEPPSSSNSDPPVPASLQRMRTRLQDGM
ncbi:hypothetical protein L3X38_001953 [Prunus dulcis]|uniref:Uncharacterized protein n=1 Tax=Prunus dulcis TaxID=3755 RepID=A0AAD4WVG9_PRUDU|nr:hypothetical protein L3X38_001953 [Prunus dulcis]